ncbi:MAG: DNA-binding response regulator [Calditrichaeota bacterium]|nr:MAG: DNA-binding response regulator [Calditrichota bacterium]
MKCVVVDDEKMSRQVIKHCIEKTESLSLVKEFGNSVEAFEFLNGNEIDLLFLDVEMPDLNGIELLQNLENKPLVILITSKEEFALDAYRNDVVDYLVKPVTLPRFLKAVVKTQRLFHNVETIEDSSKDFIFIRENQKLVKIYVTDIYWIESLGDYVVIHTESKKHTIYTTLTNILSKLPKDQFVRVHRSFIVRIDKISLIEGNSIIIKKELIPISKSYKNILIEKLNLI